MTKYVLTEAQTQRLISELFSQKLVNQLADRFRQEQPDLEDQVINFYINRFQEIKDSPKVQQKDITTYSWTELKELVDYNQPEDITIEGGEELIYDNEYLKIYRTNSKQACVKYGTGYKFCISSRGKDNMYNDFRFGMEGTSPSTIYFVIDEGRTKRQKEDGTFADPLHILIIMAVKKYFEHNGKKLSILKYQVTTANNDGEKTYDYISDIIEQVQPKLHGLEELFKYVEPHPTEKQYKNLTDEYDDKFIKLMQQSGVKWNPENGMVVFGLKELSSDDQLGGVFKNYLNNEPAFVYTFPDYPEGPLPVVYPKKVNPLVYLKFLEDYMSYDVTPEDVDEIKITSILPEDPKYREYLENVKTLFSEFLHKKNQFNIPN